MLTSCSYTSLTWHCRHLPAVLRVSSVLAKCVSRIKDIWQSRYLQPFCLHLSEVNLETSLLVSSCYFPSVVFFFLLSPRYVCSHCYRIFRNFLLSHCYCIFQKLSAFTFLPHFFRIFLPSHCFRIFQNCSALTLLFFRISGPFFRRKINCVFQSMTDFFVKTSFKIFDIIERVQ
jgi:hypothetical protein